MLEHRLRDPSGESSADDSTFGGLGRSSAELVERFMDGSLSDRERSVFEKSLEKDAVLREHVALQKRLDASLRGKLMPSDRVIEHIASSLAEISDEGVSTSASRRETPLPKSRINWLRVAATVALVVSGYLAYSAIVDGKRPTQKIARIAPERSFEREVSEGMQPYAVCTTGTEFAEYTRAQLGVALSMRPVEGLKLIGWDYDYVFSNRTILLLASYHEKPVVIFMDKVDVGPDNTCGGGPNESGRVLGTVYLHEVRAAGLPSFLDAFEIVK